MNWTILLGYLLLLVSHFFAVPSVIIALIGGVIGRITRNYHLGILLGAVITWAGISSAWKFFFDYEMPLLAFVISMTFLFSHGNISYNELNKNARKMIVGQLWGIIIIAMYTLIFIQFNWY